uniref:Uncharacterized protein n=1 Tax=Arundo donax TaxID=35708 RepID=A0A0A9H9E8_ARUDO
MTDAMLTSKCCYDSFCDKCIRDYIIAQLKCVCGVEILADDLIPNQTLRSTIAGMLSSRGGGCSNGTEKITSSITSNLDTNSLSFTASTMLKGDMKQHKDNAPLVTNLADHHEKLTHSDIQSRARENAKTSAKNTMATADAMKIVTEPRSQKQSPPEGITAVSGALERKVIKTKSKKKQKMAGTTGNGNTNCAEYDATFLNHLIITLPLNLEDCLGELILTTCTFCLRLPAATLWACIMSVASVTYHCTHPECKATQ